MRGILNWVGKLLLCWGLGFLAYRFLNPLSCWLNSAGVIGVFLMFLLAFGYVGLLAGVAAIDRALGLDKEKESLMRGILCALGGVPTTVICAIDFWNGVYSSGWVGLSMLLFVHVLFGGILFCIGYHPNKMK